MRIVFRRGNGEAVALSFPVIVSILLILLATLGGASAVVVSSSRNAERDVAARMGAKKNYAVLPEMSVALGGGSARTMDLRVRLELDPSVDPHVTDPYAARVADRLSDRIREIEPERLDGAEGAKLIKSTISSVVTREVRTIKVRDVLLERMVVR